MRSPTPGYLVWRLSVTWRTAVDAAIAHLDLTHARYSLLSTLRGMNDEGRVPTQREIADHTGLDPIYVSKLARTLADQGFLRRTTDPHDSRAVRLLITDRGTEVIDPAIAIVRALQDDLLAPLGGVGSPATAEFTRTLALLLDRPREDPS